MDLESIVQTISTQATRARDQHILNVPPATAEDTRMITLDFGNKGMLECGRWWELRFLWRGRWTPFMLVGRY